MWSTKLFNILRPSRISNVKLIHKESITKSPLYLLRQRTGLAYNLCREALVIHGNDLEQAEVWLKAQALTRALQKATVVGSRSAKEGVIGLAINLDNKTATVMELNCETDFVAKNQMFKDLALSITETISTSKGFTKVEEQSSVTIFKASQETISETESEIVPMISRLGENIKIGHATRFEISEPNSSIFGRVHAQSQTRNVQGADLMVGRFASLVGIKYEASRGISPNLGNRLCQHVIGFNPTYIELPEALRAKLEEAEKTMEENDDDLEEEGIKRNPRDDWPSIMDQQLIMSDDLSVRDFCKQNEIEIVYIRRFEPGTI